MPHSLSPSQSHPLRNAPLPLPPSSVHAPATATGHLLCRWCTRPLATGCPRLFMLLTCYYPSMLFPFLHRTHLGLPTSTKAPYTAHLLTPSPPTSLGHAHRVELLSSPRLLHPRGIQTSLSLLPTALARGCLSLARSPHRAHLGDGALPCHTLLRRGDALAPPTFPPPFQDPPATTVLIRGSNLPVGASHTSLSLTY